MAKYHNVGVELREASRQELKEQVERFLAQGGTIQKIDNSAKAAKTATKAWRPSYAQSFESRF